MKVDQKETNQNQALSVMARNNSFQHTFLSDLASYMFEKQSHKNSISLQGNGIL